MIISAIGDSLTEGDYGVKGKTGIANVHKENYPYFLSKSLNCTVNNYGKCGFTSTSYLKYYNEGNVDVSTSDIVIVMLGSNGGLSGSQETQGNRDYNELISLIRRDAPKAQIVLCTPPHCTENPEYSNCGYAERVQNAVDFVREYAKNNNVKLIEVAKSEKFSAETEAEMQPNDGLHFGTLGYKTLAGVIEEGLRNLGLC